MTTEHKIIHQKSMKPEHKILHKKFQQYGANAREWMRKCILLLPEIEKHRIWEQKKFGSIYEYAAKLAGMSRETVNDALRILKKAEEMPAIKKIIETKGINVVKPIVSILTKENENFWAEKASIMSRHTLETYVREIQKNEHINENSDETLFQIDKFGRTGPSENTKNPHQQGISFFGTSATAPSESIPHKKIVAMELDPEIIAQLEKLKGQGDWNELMKQFLQMRAQQLEEQKPAAVKTESRHIPNKIKRYIVARTNGTCAFPGCKKSIRIKHHTKRFALEKIHDSDRLHGLCKAHERIAHLGLIENEEAAPPIWKIKKQPDRNAPKFKIDELVATYRSG